MNVFSAEWKEYNANSKDENIGDCTARSISAAYRMDYDEVHTLLLRMKKKLNVSSYRNQLVSRSLIEELGFEQRSEFDYDKTVNEFADEHPSGTFIVFCRETPNERSSHAVAIINGRVIDSWDSRDWLIEIVYTIHSQDKFSEDDEPFRELSGVSIFNGFADDLDKYLYRISAKNPYMEIFVDYSSAEFHDDEYKISMTVFYTYDKLWRDFEDFATAMVPSTKGKSYYVPVKIGYNLAKSEEYNSVQLLKKLKQKLYDMLYNKSDKIKKKIQYWEEFPGSTTDIDYAIIQKLPSWSRNYVTYAQQVGLNNIWLTLKSDGEFFEYDGRLDNIIDQIEEDKYDII